MLIINDEQRLQAGIPSLSEQCPCCGKALATYPLILSDDVEQTVYHAACAIEVATEILVDVYLLQSPCSTGAALCPVGPSRREIASLLR